MKYELDGKILRISIDSLFNETVQSFLDDFVPSRKMQHLLIQNKWITMDSNPVKREDDIAGLELAVNIYPEEYRYVKTGYEAEIVYEDEYQIAVKIDEDIPVVDYHHEWTGSGGTL